MTDPAVHHHEHDHAERRPATGQAQAWDERYRARGDAMWSGRPNGRLVVEVEGLAPGRALDVGCGEGADAIWLAQRGWDVTAVDVSVVAVGRARAAAEAAGVAVTWIADDVLARPFPAASFDLVSLQYPALPKAAGEAALHTLLDAVRPEGVVLAVYHDLDDDHRARMAEGGFDPAEFVLDDEWRALLGARRELVVELDAVEARVDPPGGNPHIADVVLRARRRR